MVALNYLINDFQLVCCSDGNVFHTLGKFQSPAVVDALLKLLDDPDPNIRAIAAISLGRTGTKEKSVINRLLVLLDDKDRICRQSACLSLGHIKAEEGVPKISYLW